MRNKIHKPTLGIYKSPIISESRLEKILGINLPTFKSGRDLDSYSKEAAEEALKHMAVGMAILEKQKQEEEMISSSRFKQVYKGLSALAQKVYSAVPISEPWSISYIYSEMQRNGSSTKDIHIVGGCINALISAGLVSEPERGVFIRAPFKEIIEKPINPIIKKEPMAATLKIAQSPVSILSAIAARAKAASDAIRKLADDIETAALEIEEGISAGDAEMAKLKQLQQLLKSLS